MEAQLNYARKFGVHDVTAMALYMQNDYRDKSALAERYQGVTGRITYGYDDRYLAEFNACYNGSENFVKGKRFGFFPSFSVGWRISNEDFMRGMQAWLNNLKIRASFGQVGNDIYKIGGVKQRFLYEQKWIQGGGYRFGTTGFGGIYESQYPNYDVTWERANKYNVGVEFGIIRKLTGSFDYFYEKRRDILTNYLTRPWWVGVAMAAGNIGETKNSGFELELKYNDKVGNDFNYNVGFMFSRAHNEILNMDEPALQTAYQKRAGHPIGQRFGLISDGFITQADIDGGHLPISTYGPVMVGDLKYRDMNDDDFIDDRDITYIGYSDVPEHMFSLSLGCNYKNWGFNVLFQGVDRVSKYYDGTTKFAFVDGGKVKELHQQRWDPAKTEADNLANAKYPLLHYAGGGDHNQRGNTFFLSDGAFIRLKNIELNYTLPTEWSSKVGMSECRLYVNANNLVTWDRLDKLVDPESDGSNRYPIMKTVNFGVNIKF
jgi:TonB-linked SusC/RagA family outer membrane protein